MDFITNENYYAKFIILSKSSTAIESSFMFSGFNCKKRERELILGPDYSRTEHFF